MTFIHQCITGTCTECLWGLRYHPRDWECGIKQCLHPWGVLGNSYANKYTVQFDPLLEIFEQNVWNQTNFGVTTKAERQYIIHSNSLNRVPKQSIQIYTTNPLKKNTVTHLCLTCSKETILLFKRYVLRGLYKKI